MDQLDEHYTNLPTETDEPYSISSDVALGNTPSMLTNQEDIHIDEGSIPLPISSIPNPAAGDATDTIKSPQNGSDRQ